MRPAATHSYGVFTSYLVICEYRWSFSDTRLFAIFAACLAILSGEKRSMSPRDHSFGKQTLFITARRRCCKMRRSAYRFAQRNLNICEPWRGKKRAGEVFIQKIGDSLMLKWGMKRRAKKEISAKEKCEFSLYCRGVPSKDPKIRVSRMIEPRP